MTKHKPIFLLFLIFKDCIQGLEIKSSCADHVFSQDGCNKLRFDDLFGLSTMEHCDEYHERSSHQKDEEVLQEDWDDGGWPLAKPDNPASPGPCTIEKVVAEELSQNTFLTRYAFQKPVVIINATDNKNFRRLTKYDNLIRNYGHTTVKLSSANSFSYDSRETTFGEYCQAHLGPQSVSTLGNETFYFFGDNSNEDWFSLLEEYLYPPYFLPDHLPQLSFGIAGPGSGVPFHFHGPVFAETLWGRKRWFMYSPELSPRFHPNQTTLQWLHQEYASARRDTYLLECTLGPGEMIYFPDHWWHATLNVDTTVFMSTFLSP